MMSLQLTLCNNTLLKCILFIYCVNVCKYDIKFVASQQLEVIFGQHEKKDGKFECEFLCITVQHIVKF